VVRERGNKEFLADTRFGRDVYGGLVEEVVGWMVWGENR
jgi:hypothetical protein